MGLHAETRVPHLTDTQGIGLHDHMVHGWELLS